MDGLSHLGIALAALAGPWQIAYALGATLAGIVIGLLPGLSATLGVALFTTLTVKMPPTDAILVLVCVYVGAIYGGSRTAILLNIPGTAANAAACLDGHSSPARAGPDARWASPPRARSPARCSAWSAWRCSRRCWPRPR